MPTTIDRTSQLTRRDVPTKGSRATLTKVSLACGIGVVASAGRNRPLRVAGWLLVGVGVANIVSPFTPMHTRAVLAAGGTTWTDTAHLTVDGGAGRCPVARQRPRPNPRARGVRVGKR